MLLVSGARSRSKNFPVFSDMKLNIHNLKLSRCSFTLSVADPGFPVGGGAWTL